jgi:hypothetical protein
MFDPVPMDTDVDADLPGGGIFEEAFEELRFWREPDGCVGPLARGSGCT